MSKPYCPPTWNNRFDRKALSKALLEAADSLMDLETDNAMDKELADLALQVRRAFNEAESELHHLTRLLRSRGLK